MGNMQDKDRGTNKPAADKARSDGSNKPEIQPSGVPTERQEPTSK